MRKFIPNIKGLFLLTFLLMLCQISFGQTIYKNPFTINSFVGVVSYTVPDGFDFNTKITADSFQLNGVTITEWPAGGEGWTPASSLTLTNSETETSVTLTNDANNKLQIPSVYLTGTLEVIGSISNPTGTLTLDDNIIIQAPNTITLQTSDGNADIIINPGAGSTTISGNYYSISGIGTISGVSLNLNATSIQNSTGKINFLDDVIITGSIEDTGGNVTIDDNLDVTGNLDVAGSISFDDANSAYSATGLDAAIVELASVNPDGVNDTAGGIKGKVDWSQLLNVPAGFADGTDDGAGGGSGTMTTVKEDNVQVGGADIVTLDFGTGFDVAETPDTEVQITFDSTEIGTTTWGSGSGITWTFNAGADDPIITFASGAITLETALITLTNTTIQGSINLANDSDGDTITIGNDDNDTLTINANIAGTPLFGDDVTFNTAITVNGNTILGDDVSDTLTIKATTTGTNATFQGSFNLATDSDNDTITIGNSGTDILTINASPTITGSGEMTINKALDVNATVTLDGSSTSIGDDISDTLTVNATSTLTNTTIQGAINLATDSDNDTITLGSSSGDTLTVNASTTVTADFAVNGNTTIGNASSDTITFNTVKGIPAEIGMACGDEVTDTTLGVKFTLYMPYAMRVDYIGASSAAYTGTFDVGVTNSAGNSIISGAVVNPPSGGGYSEEASNTSYDNLAQGDKLVVVVDTAPTTGGAGLKVWLRGIKE